METRECKTPRHQVAHVTYPTQGPCSLRPARTVPLRDVDRGGECMHGLRHVWGYPQDKDPDPEQYCSTFRL